MNGAVFNKNDYRILSTFDDKESYTEISSLTIKQIANNTNLSIPKVRSTVKNFVLVGFLKEGAKDGISKTYYITKEGIDHVTKITQIDYEEE